MEKYPQNDAPLSAAPRLVVVDQGSIYTKLTYDLECATYLSVHAPVSRGHSLGGPEYLDAVRVDSDPTWYAFGPNMTRIADLNRISHVSTDARYTSDSYRRGMAYALFRAHAHVAVDKSSKDSFTPVVVASIPAGEFKRNKTKIEANLTGKYTVRGVYEGVERPYRFNVTLDNLNVLPEGTGTYYDLVQAEEQGLSKTNYSKGITAIASWGWYTLSIIMFDNGEHVAGVIDSNDMVGMQSVAESIYNRLGIQPGASIAEIDKHMQGDTLVYHGRELRDFPKFKAQEVKQAADQGLSWLQGKIRRSQLSVDNLIFTGGTSDMFWRFLDIENHSLRDMLPANILKVDNAAREDADGAWRFFDYMMNQGI